MCFIERVCERLYECVHTCKCVFCMPTCTCACQCFCTCVYECFLIMSTLGGLFLSWLQSGRSTVWLAQRADEMSIIHISRTHRRDLRAIHCTSRRHLLLAFFSSVAALLFSAEGDGDHQGFLYRLAMCLGRRRRLATSWRIVSSTSDVAS